METVVNDKEKKALRRELETWVTSMNSPLKESVKEMSLIILLRNVHPSVRADFAYRLKDLEMLKPEEAKEFIKPVEPMFKGFRS